MNNNGSGLKALRSSSAGLTQTREGTGSGHTHTRTASIRTRVNPKESDTDPQPNPNTTCPLLLVSQLLSSSRDKSARLIRLFESF